MSSPQFVNQQRQLFYSFQNDGIYGLRISQDQSGTQKRLVKGKVGTFSWGFIFDEHGEDKFPTLFYLLDKRFDEVTGEFTLIGKIRDPNDEKYFLSLELDNDDPESYIKSGYNDKGDWVELNIKLTQSNDNGSWLLRGLVRGVRHPHTYSLVDSNEKKIFNRGPNGEQYYIYLESKPRGNANMQ